MGIGISIVTRIFWAFLLIVLLLIGVVLTNIRSLGAIARENTVMAEMRALDGEFVMRELQHFQWAAGLRDFMDDRTQARLQVETDFRLCGLGTWFYGDGRRRAETLVPPLAELLPGLEQPHIDLHRSAVMVEQAVAAGTSEVARAREIYASHSAPALRKVQAVLAEMRVVVREAVDRQEEIVARAMRTAVLTVTISLFLCALLVAVVGLLTKRGLVAVMAGVGREMAEGSSQVSAAAGQVADSSQSLAEGSTEQAASVEQVSAALQEVTAMTSRDTDNIRQTDALMQEAGRVTAAAGASMQRLVASMREISEAGGETQKIVKTIDEIAFQTNLLALNAAVEAARAGEAGAGFAVVADEVRNLAMRAAEAAHTTSSLIDGTVAKVAAGTSLVAETSASFRNATESVEKISTLIRELAESSTEQSKAVEQVASALNQIETVVQRNAATAEEAASASEELSAQSATLRQTVREMIRSVGGIDESIFNETGGVNPSRQAISGGGGRQRPAPSSRGRSVKKERWPQLPESGAVKRGDASAQKSASQAILFDDDGFKDF